MGIVYISRADQLKDLVLTLPALGHLRKNLPEDHLVLHGSQPAEDIALLALHNGLCQSVVLRDPGKNTWITHGKEIPDGVAEHLSFVHCREVRELQRRQKFRFSMGPRTSLLSLCCYKKTVPLHAHRTESSEMEDNVRLAQAYLKHRGVKGTPFAGLAPLRIPKDWRASSEVNGDTALFLNSDVLSKRWSFEENLRLVERLVSEGHLVDVHYAGFQIEDMKKKAQQLGQRKGVRVIHPFPKIRNMLAYLSRQKKVIAFSSGPLHMAHALGVPVLGIYPREPKSQSFKRGRPHGYWHTAPVEFMEI